jgi:hypothetical protein
MVGGRTVVASREEWTASCIGGERDHAREEEPDEDVEREGCQDGVNVDNAPLKHVAGDQEDERGGDDGADNARGKDERRGGRSRSEARPPGTCASEGPGARESTS